MSKENVKRDNEKLLDSVYDNLMKISEEIQSSGDASYKLVDSFDSLLRTYFDIVSGEA